MRKPETDTELTNADEVQPSDGTARRQNSARARLAEECLISVGTFRVRRKGTWQTAGAIEWRSERTGRLAGIARYRINGIPGAEPRRKFPANSAGAPVLVLATGDFAQTIYFRSSAVTYGRRFYFACDCGRKCGKLFLPPGGNRFTCRWCHKLRYDSQRHECDWFYRPLAASTGVKKRILKKFYHAIGDSVLNEIYGRAHRAPA
jgi:hypothetical protein